VGKNERSRVSCAKNFFIYGHSETETFNVAMKRLSTLVIIAFGLTVMADNTLASQSTRVYEVKGVRLLGLGIRCRRPC